MKSFRLGLFPNQYRNTQNDPDATGSLQIPLSVISELYAGLSDGSIHPKQGYGEGAEAFVELRAAAWKSDGSPSPTGKQRPVISIVVDSPTETRDREAQRAQRQAQAPAANQWGGQPPAPAGNFGGQQAPAAQPAGQWGGQQPNLANSIPF